MRSVFPLVESPDNEIHMSIENHGLTYVCLCNHGWETHHEGNPDETKPKQGQMFCNHPENMCQIREERGEQICK